MPEQNRYLRPCQCVLSPHQASKVNERLGFWFRLFTGSLYVFVAAFIIMIAGIFQIFSIAVSTGEVNFVNLVVSIVLSFYAVKILKTIIPFEEYMAQTEYGIDGTRNVGPDRPGIIILLFLLFFIVVLAGGLAFQISSTLADLSLKSTLRTAQSNGTVIDFALSVILHLLLVGTILTAISGVMVGWYTLYQVRKGVHYWFIRLEMIIKYKLTTLIVNPDEQFHEWIEDRCQQCFGVDFSIIQNDDPDNKPKLLCSRCGLEKGQAVIEPPVSETNFDSRQQHQEN